MIMKIIFSTFLYFPREIAGHLWRSEAIKYGQCSMIPPTKDYATKNTGRMINEPDMALICKGSNCKFLETLQRPLSPQQTVVDVLS